MPKSTTPCPQPGLEPGPLTQESSALTMRLPHLPPCRALLANIKMEYQGWPEKPFILERSATQYVVMVTKRFILYCGAHKNWLRYLFSSHLISSLGNLHIAKNLISLERKVIFGNSKQPFSSYSDYLCFKMA